MLRRTLTLVGAVALLATPALAQFTESFTGFETDREGNPLVFQPGSYGDLRVAVFQDPREADVTLANILPDNSPNADTSGALPATEESFVANFTNDFYFGAGGSDQFLDIRFQWANTNGDRWCLVETFQSPYFGDPSIHLDGEVRMKVNLPVFTSEFPALNYTDRIGVALLIRETGNNIPQGFRDSGSGALEFVGVSSVSGADTANPVPVPTTYIDGPTSSGDQGWVSLTFDLDTANVVGWTFNGGDGILDASTNGDMVNRGVLAGLVLTVDPSDAHLGASDYVEFLVDDIEFDAPVNDPAYPPSVASPVSQGQTTVRVKDVLSTATNVTLQIDTTAPYDYADATSYPYTSGLPGVSYVDITVATLAVGDHLRARQTNPSGTSAYSAELIVNPPAAFSVTVALDQDGNNGVAPADYDFLGAASTILGAPQGKPIQLQSGSWQNIEFSLIPGIEQVASFVGGYGQLIPDGGLYDIDSLWFSIDPTVPNAGPFDVYIDHVYYIDEDDNEVLISDVEGGNPFPLYRGQSTSTDGFSTISTVASYDGTHSTHLGWSWPSVATSNTIAVYRPYVSFDDTAKAIGMWLYVPEASTNAIAAPSVAGPIVGDVDGVIVNFTTNSVTSAELFLNGGSVGVINTTGVLSVTFDTSSITSVLGDQFTATQTIGADTSDISIPRVVTLPPKPTIQPPVRSVDGTIIVNGVLDVPFSQASKISVFDTNGVLVGSTGFAGTTTEVPVSVALSAGDLIYATQTANSLESLPSVIVTVIAPSASCLVGWTENFDVDPTANWTVNSGVTDSVANFFFDYSTVGIPPAPGSNGTTRGLKMQANLTSGVFGGMSVSPTGQTFTGDFKLVFDLWANFNGPFPGGGSGSTNLSMAGVLTDGTTTTYPGSIDAVVFGCTADGGSSADWRAYSPAAVASYQNGDPVYSAASRNNTDTYYAQFGGVQAPDAQTNAFPQQTGTTQVGAAGMQWHQVEINKAGNFVTWQVDGLPIATVNITGMTLGGDNILFGHSDINATSSTDANAPSLLFTLIDNVRVLVPQDSPVTQGDWDGDGDSDMDDFAQYIDCLGGPGAEPDYSISDCGSACLATFDADADDDVDLRDFQALTNSGLFTD